jgi:serine protease inhibitor
MKLSISLLVLVSCLFVSACHDNGVQNDNPPNLRTLSAAEMRIASGANDFAFRLFNKVDHSDNTFISPLSVSIVLGMVMNGASPETRQSILNTIDYGDFSADEVNQGYKDLTSLLLSMDKTVKVGIANGVWYNQDWTVRTPFKNTVENYYDAPVKGLNFTDPKSVDVVNEWVEDKTNDRIKNLLNGIDPQEIMFLVNTIYFKGDWTYAFDKAATNDAPFYLENGSTTTTRMMHATGVTMKYFANNQVQLIDIPYGNEQFRFTILLPADGKNLDDLSSVLSADVLAEWITQANDMTADLDLPKFKFEWKKDLKDILGSMGLQMVDFPGLFDTTRDLAISRVIHQSFVDVNEIGTEAAAATAVGIITTSMPPRVTINRPFVFLIRERHSNTVLFIGGFKTPVQPS